MDFIIPPELLDLQDRTRAFIRDKIIPLEGDPSEVHRWSLAQKIVKYGANC